MRESAFASFGIGQLVAHRMFGYRGVVFDVDPVFAGTEEWYDRVARSRPPKDSPWYHVLVDGTDTITYVAERNLAEDDSGQPIAHPMVETLFSDCRDGTYTARRTSS